MQPESPNRLVMTIRWTAIFGGGLLLLGIILAVTAGQVAVQMSVALVFGWWNYLARVIPRVTVSRAGLITVLLCGALFTFGLHNFLKWLHRGMIGGEHPWKVRWTCSIVGVVVLMFAAGIATVGMTHQTAWLMTSKRPLTDAHPDHFGGGSRQVEWNLKMIALAVSNYASAHEALPGDRPQEGQGFQSWQTVIMGYLPYYADIDFDRPYDDPKNSAKFKGFIHDYLNPSATVLRDERGFALSHFAGNVYVFGQGRSMKLTDFNRSQTMMAGEVASGFKCWGDPTNLRDPERPFDGSPQAFGSPSGGGATVLMMDGSVKFISDRADPKILRALSGRK